MKYVIDAKQGKDYDVIVCGAGTAGVVAAMRHICLSDPERIFSFTLSNTGLKSLADISETYLLARTQRRYKSLEFYKSFT